MQTSRDRSGSAAPAAATFRCGLWCGLILTLALVLRTVAVGYWSEDLSSDPDVYVAHAETLLHGNGFCVPGSDRLTAFRPPGYPMLLAAGRAVGIPMVPLAGLINIVAGVLTVGCSMELARLAGLSGRQVPATGLIVALDPLLLRYSAQPMTEVLSAALLTAALVFQLRGGWKSASAAGVIMSWAAVTRPVFLVTAFLLSAASLRSKQRSWKERLGFLAGFSVLVVPWVIRNALVFERFIPATTHGGYTLLLGNNEVFYREVVLAEGQPVWSGASLSAWQSELERSQREAGVSDAGEVVQDQWMYAQAEKAIADNRQAFVSACVLRLRRFFGVMPEVPSGSLFRRLIVGGICGSVMIGLAMSIVSAAVSGRGTQRWLWLVVLSFVCVHTFYWTNTRMRAPLAGPIAVLSVCGWSLVVGRRNSGGSAVLNEEQVGEVA